MGQTHIFYYNKSMLSKKRHIFYTNFFKPLACSIAKKFHPIVDFKIDEPEGAVILSNHETSADQFYISCNCKQVIYWMCTKDIIQRGLAGRFLMHCFGPIMKEKNNRRELAHVKQAMQYCKENKIIGIFPEGNRTFNGDLCSIDDSIAKLIKKIGKKVIIINIDGYNVEPRWSSHQRKGNTYVSIRSIISAEDIEKMDAQLLQEKIIHDLKPIRKEQLFPSNKSAEYFERLAFICPICGNKHTISSKGQYITCSKCHTKIKYTEKCKLESDNPFFTFKTAGDWYNWQIEYLKHQQYQDNQLIYEDNNILCFLPVLYKRAVKLGRGKLQLYTDHFKFINKKGKEYVFRFEDIPDATILGRVKFTIYYNGVNYQFKGNDKINFLKYMLTFYILKYRRGENPSYYLGI